MELIKKIKDYVKNKLNTFIFFIILIIVSCLYNLNLQTVNFILSRGTTLIYSYKTENNAEYKKNIETALKNLKIKYQLLEEDDISLYGEYDNNFNKIENIFLVSIPLSINKNNVWLFDKISSVVFENLKESELISIRPLNRYYHQPYATFLIYLMILSVTLVIWIIILLCFRFKNTKEKIIAFFKKKKEEKEDKPEIKKDIKYYLKKLILDDDKIEDSNTNIAYEIVSTIVFVLICVVIIRYFIGEIRWIPSGSMRPTIVEKDRVFVEKLDYPTKKEIKRGDILVFYPPSERLSNSPLKILARLTGIFCKDMAYIKRVVGLPGDKLEIKHDDKTQIYKVYINDNPLNEPYISSDINWTPCDREKMYCGPFLIPENNYFMMGDNRNNSQDSRFWGFLDRKRVIGRANYMFYPLSRINVLTDKYFTLNKNKTKKEIYILDRY